jgi:AmmeMemoRadiSam system protein B
MKYKTGEIACDEIREPAVAGQFYPGDANDLRLEMSAMLQRPPSRRATPPREVIAGVAPHAGYMYSGAVAARFYLFIAGAAPSLAVIISPSHRERFAAISIFGGRAYRTPLGEVPVNREAADDLFRRGAPFINDWRGHNAEHALEVQLPFLQMLWPELTIVPIVMGEQSADFCEQLGSALAETLRHRRAIIVASSDLSHYHSHQQARQIDQRVLRAVRKFDPERLLKDFEGGRAEACGGGPMVAAMLAARRLGATKAQVLGYRDSSAVSGDESQVVGYMAAAFFKA